MNKVLISFFFFSWGNVIYGQNIPYEYKLDTDTLVITFDSIGQSLNYQTDEYTLTFTLLNAKGASFCQKFDSEGRRLFEGYFANGLDILKKQVIAEEPTTGDFEYYVRLFIEPLKDGKWIYYSKDGNIIKVDNFRNGILIR